MRVAVRVRPGSVGQIEIQGEERNVLAVATVGTQPIDLEFAPSVYTPNTAAIYISWGPMPAFVERAPVEPETPEFVSPTTLPKNVTEPAGAEPAPSASDIVSPADAAGSAFAAPRRLMRGAGRAAPARHPHRD